VRHGAGHQLPPLKPRPSAIARLEHDAATLLVGIEREPATAIEKICADVKELGVLAKTWATGYVTETHAKSLKRAQEAREAHAPAAVRAAVDRVATQLDAVFEGVVEACLAGPVRTGRHGGTAAAGGALVECVKICLAEPALKGFLVPILNAKAGLARSNDDALGARLGNRRR